MVMMIDAAIDAYPLDVPRRQEVRKLERNNSRSHDQRIHELQLRHGRQRLRTPITPHYEIVDAKILEELVKDMEARIKASRIQAQEFERILIGSKVSVKHREIIDSEIAYSDLLVSYEHSLIYSAIGMIVSGMFFGICIFLFASSLYFYFIPAVIGMFIAGCIAAANFDALLKVYQKLRSQTDAIV